MARPTPRPNTSAAHPQYKVTPYMRGGAVARRCGGAAVRANQVWRAVIACVRPERGLACLAAVVNWHSRRVLSGRVSHTMAAAFCMDGRGRA